MTGHSKFSRRNQVKKRKPFLWNTENLLCLGTNNEKGIKLDGFKPIVVNIADVFCK
jgi:hypothetical protein